MDRPLGAPSLADLAHYELSPGAPALTADTPVIIRIDHRGLRGAIMTTNNGA
jgi:hypothetical protein